MKSVTRMIDSDLLPEFEIRDSLSRNVAFSPASATVRTTLRRKHGEYEQHQSESQKYIKVDGRWRFVPLLRGGFSADSASGPGSVTTAPLASNHLHNQRIIYTLATTPISAFPQPALGPDRSFTF